MSEVRVKESTERDSLMVIAERLSERNEKWSKLLVRLAQALDEDPGRARQVVELLEAVPGAPPDLRESRAKTMRMIRAHFQGIGNNWQNTEQLIKATGKTRDSVIPVLYKTPFRANFERKKDNKVRLFRLNEEGNSSK